MEAKCCVTWDFAVNKWKSSNDLLCDLGNLAPSSPGILIFPLIFFSHLFQCFSEWAFFVIPVFNFHRHRSGHGYLTDSHLLKVTVYSQTSKLYTLVIKRNPALYQDAWPTTYKTFYLFISQSRRHGWVPANEIHEHESVISWKSKQRHIASLLCFVLVGICVTWLERQKPETWTMRGLWKWDPCLAKDKERSWDSNILKPHRALCISVWLLPYISQLSII